MCFDGRKTIRQQTLVAVSNFLSAPAAALCTQVTVKCQSMADVLWLSNLSPIDLTIATLFVTFGRLAVIDFDGRHCLFIYCVVRFRTLVHFRRCRFENVGECRSHVYLAVSALVYSGLDFSRCQRSI